MALNHNKLIAVIGDEDTCVGFLLGGVGEKDFSKKPERNILVVGKNTLQDEVAEAFKNFLKRSDVAVILINQTIAESIRDLIDAHTAAIPSVVEIPSKDSPFDPEKDSILKKAREMFLI